MANRRFEQFTGLGLLKKTVRLYCVFSYASSGNTVTLKKWDYAAGALAAAPTATGISPYQTGDAGIKSIARNGTGIYTITLQDGYSRLLGVQYLGTVAASGVSTVVAVGTWSTVTSPSTGVIKVTLSSATATAADPADGDVITLAIDLQDSSEP